MEKSGADGACTEFSLGLPDSLLSLNIQINY